VLEAIVTGAVEKAMAKPRGIPAVLANLLPPEVSEEQAVGEAPEKGARNVIFLIKSSPIDDEFALWLAPKLEAEGYRVFADILTLQPGDRWRREINAALQYRAAKVLLLCRNATLSDHNVQEDVDIALEVSKELSDPRFVIPLRLEAGRKVKGIGDAVAVDFVRGWGEGLGSLLDALKRQKVARSVDQAVIDPNWEIFRRRGAIPLIDEPERLTSNWLRIVEGPDVIRYFESAGVVDRNFLQRAIVRIPMKSPRRSEMMSPGVTR
jgi:TIR domain-containing protein